MKATIYLAPKTKNRLTGRTEQSPPVLITKGCIPCCGTGRSFTDVGSCRICGGRGSIQVPAPVIGEFCI